MMRARQSSFVSHWSCRTAAIVLLLLVANLGVVQSRSILRAAAQVEEGRQLVDISESNLASFIGSNYGISQGRKSSASKGSKSHSTTKSSKSSSLSSKSSTGIEEESSAFDSVSDTKDSSDLGVSSEESNAALDNEGDYALESEEEESPIDDSDSESSVKVAHVGNSMQYYGDTPRFLEHMLQTRYESVTQDSCLRPASTLWSVWTKGNNMGDKFNSTAAIRDDGTLDIGAPTVEALLEKEEWDYVVLNDRSQNPTREESRNKSLGVLEDDYAKAFDKSSVILFIQTPSYRLEGIRDTEDLGDFDEFTERVRDGVQQYIDLMQELGFEAEMAPVGDVYATIRAENRDLSDKLFHTDDFHPSPLGTWLQCCVLHCIITGEFTAAL